MTNSINLPYHYTVTMIQHTEFTITASDFHSAGCTLLQHNGTRCSGSISIGSAIFCKHELTL